ncbi:DsbA family protein [Thermostaphylospora chromogena]|uniref:Protein-disulfide isomerase n=1 Tax=Thermostaphylospora chromogena TaxID=35622 RepID=A0A1H1GE45_9ACTN|nr:thioredoxin domain-containing protein [Thermostaphylospora chromogena]SDR11460.1 Protein-disulfide isomerase [Thermostaphylospora chromogena]
MGKAARNTAVRERVRAQREAEKRREKIRRIVTTVTVAVVAVAAIAAGWWYSAQQGRSETATENLAPISRQSDGSIVMAKAGVESPVLEIYEDFQCPACKLLEETSGPTIKNLAAEGRVKVVFHTVTIFGQDPTRANSVRAAAAARCVPEDKWMAYHDKLFEEQPSETVEGFKVDDLVGWGEDVGVSDPAFEKCVTSQQHAQAHTDNSDKVLKAENIQGTPTVRLNGTDLGDTAFSPAQLREAVLQAAK